jgi:hypothetical protein
LNIKYAQLLITGTNSLLFGLSGLICVNTFSGAALTAYLTYLGIMSIAAIPNQVAQTISFFQIQTQSTSDYSFAKELRFVPVA